MPDNFLDPIESHEMKKRKLNKTHQFDGEKKRVFEEEAEITCRKLQEDGHGGKRGIGKTKQWKPSPNYTASFT